MGCLESQEVPPWALQLLSLTGEQIPSVDLSQLPDPSRLQLQLLYGSHIPAPLWRAIPAQLTTAHSQGCLQSPH